MRDGFFRAPDGVHVLTRHLTQWALVKDVAAPTAPTDLGGTFDGSSTLTLHWKAGKDNSELLGVATVYADGVAVASAPSGTTELSVGKVAAGDPRSFTVVQTDYVGNASAPTRALRVLPDLTGLTPDQARAALRARGLVVGNVTTADAPGVQPGTVAEPKGPATALEGTAIDIVVAAGGPQTKLAFDVVGTTRVTASPGGRVAARISVSKPASVTAKLYSPQSKELKTWKFKVRAGISIVKLQLPQSVKTAGRYKLTWVARAGFEQIKRTIVVEVVKRGSPPAKNTKAVEVVLVGAADLRDGLAVSLEGSNIRVTSAVDENEPFTLAGSPTHNVHVVVVDVDEFSLSLVHDLRTVFPGMAIVALTDDPDKLGRAVAAGATVALPLSSPPSQLAKVVAKLAL
jgi:hypothetical protein